MSKERYNQIIDEAYKNYVSTHEDLEWTDDFCKKNLKDYGDQWDIFSKEEFINKCKTDDEFSEEWGLKIEERELSLEERNDLLNKETNRNHKRENCFSDEEFERETLQDCKVFNIPTKQITLEYVGTKIEVYE